MANQINQNLPKDKDLAKQVLDSQNEIDKLKTERGWLGNIWGNSGSIPNNIAALSVLLLILAGIFYSFINFDKDATKLSLSIKEFWAIILPFTSLCVGYLFGDYASKKKTHYNNG